ncbi:hypothetical protein NQ318_014979 [Aromia moschata]|uniref:Protein YIPF n=1 Tax=Aromia moschata TaxID=1265417 RepID=A0AAV8YXH2_9CUCU|nr:hypothetical protein NQ318_014979 [Aromia moschata]
MTNLQEVPTEELLSFHDYPTVHSAANNTTIPISEAQIQTHSLEGNFQNSPNRQGVDYAPEPANESPAEKPFWSVEYYQKFFDVDTKDVVERIIASVTPRWDNSLKRHLRTKPDLYGPFWISVTLIFAIAISSNIANYLQHANDPKEYHWKYNFHLVSYAATTICLYVTLIPFTLWGLLKWSSQIDDIEDLGESLTPGALELICIYGYSLFIYIPASVLWSIQIDLLQWLLTLIAAFISSSVLLLTLMPALKLSRHKFLLALGILACHLLLAAGFMLYFFPNAHNTAAVVQQPLKQVAVAVAANNTHLASEPSKV